MLSVQFLLIFMIIAAIIAVEMRDMISSVIAIAALGLGLSLSFLILRSPDLAIILLIVETITLTLLVKASLETSRITHKRSDIFVTVAMVLFSAFFLFLSFEAIREIPGFGFPIMRVSQHYFEEAFSKLNCTNVLTSVFLGFRGYDTLGGLLILFAVTIGIKSVTDKVRRKR